MGTTTALRAELRRTWVPLLERKGFSVHTSDAPTFVGFCRKTSESAHLLELQWEKYGRPRFVVNFGKCALEGLLIRGERFPVENVCVGWLEEHGRLQPRRGHSTSHWFSQEVSLLKRFFAGQTLRAPAEVVQELVALFPEVETYWATGEVGDHLMMVRIPRNEQAAQR
jgi:hypothetical protein